MNVCLTKEQAEAIRDVAKGDSFDYLRLKEVSDKVDAALRMEKRRTTEGNVRVKVGERILGIRQASILRYIGLYPQHATVKHIAPALFLHHTHVYLILRRLREKGLIQERRWTGSWPQKFYELTQEGRAVIARMRYLDVVEGKMPAMPLPQGRASESQSGGDWVEWIQANA